MPQAFTTPPFSPTFQVVLQPAVAQSTLSIECSGGTSVSKFHWPSISADKHSPAVSPVRHKWPCSRKDSGGRTARPSSLGTKFLRGSCSSFMRGAGMQDLQEQVNNCMPQVWPVSGSSQFGNTIFTVPGNDAAKLERQSSPEAFFNFRKPATPSIVAAGDPVLHEPAEDVPLAKIGTPEIEKIINDMVAVMRAAPGVGLAAPQIGIPYRIIVLEDTTEYISYVDPKEVEEQNRRPFPLQVILNPKLKVLDGPTAVFFEGCLSVDGYRALVERAVNVMVEGIGRDGQPIQLEATGWQARILQHECDHLEGTIYVDRMLPRSFRTTANLQLPLACGCRKPGVYSPNVAVLS